VAPIEHQICGTIHRLCRQGGAIISADTDTDSHGVSDPSGHARGHFQRAHRGRSRHGSCSDRGAGACSVGGKERRPSCWCRALTVKLAARQSVIGGAGGGASLASLMPGGSARTGSGDNINFRGRPQGRPLLLRQATSTRGERCRYCRESSTHSTRPSSRSMASATIGEPAIQSVFRGSSNHCW
jgi:hypothetical protein